MSTAVEWRSIPGFKGYEASNIGDIRSLKRGRGPRVLAQWKTNIGYMTIPLINNCGERQTQYVHRLVMRAFKGYSSLQVDHVSEDKTDNRRENLRYCSAEENHGYHYAKRGHFDRGIMYIESVGNFSARPYINGKIRHLGHFKTRQEAVDAVTYAKETGDYFKFRRKKASKYKYISFSKPHNQWVARRTIKGKVHYIGHFEDEELAKKAVDLFNRRRKK